MFFYPDEMYLKILDYRPILHSYLYHLVLLPVKTKKLHSTLKLTTFYIAPYFPLASDPSAASFLYFNFSVAGTRMFAWMANLQYL